MILILSVFVLLVVHILQWMLQVPGATSFIGCIGKDKYGEEMKKHAKLAGLKVNFRYIFLIT